MKIMEKEMRIKIKDNKEKKEKWKSRL